MSDFGINLGVGEVLGEVVASAGEAAASIGKAVGGIALSKISVLTWFFLGPGCVELNSSEAEWIEEAKRREEMYKFLRLGIVKTDPNISEEELEKQVKALYDEIFNKSIFNSYAASIELIKNMGNNINNISVDGNNAKVGEENNYNDNPVARRANLTVIVGGGGGKEPDKKPDKDPKKVATKILAGTGAAIEVATMLSPINNQDTTDDVTSPFDPNNITRVTDTGTGQVAIDYKDGTRRIVDKEDVPGAIQDRIIRGASGKGGLEDANLLDDTGKFIDDMLENNYQKYVDRKTKKKQTPRERLDWKQESDYWTKESPVARGNNFNRTVREADIYDYHEIYLENGKRLDSYDPDAGEIISRKATDLDKISEETYREYLSEFAKKYSRGTKIRSNAYPELDGQELKGKYILEIPASNANIENIDYYKQIAAEYDVTLRFTEELQ